VKKSEHLLAHENQCHLVLEQMRLRVLPSQECHERSSIQIFHQELYQDFHLKGGGRKASLDGPHGAYANPYFITNLQF